MDVSLLEMEVSQPEVLEVEISSKVMCWYEVGVGEANDTLFLWLLLRGGSVFSLPSRLCCSANDQTQDILMPPKQSFTVFGGRVPASPQ